MNIPAAALEAGAKELAMQCRCAMACDWRNHLDDARAAFLAMIEAWPGRTRDYMRVEDNIILPLTEASDDQ